MLKDITSNAFYKCTLTFWTHGILVSFQLKPVHNLRMKDSCLTCILIQDTAKGEWQVGCPTHLLPLRWKQPKGIIRDVWLFPAMCTALENTSCIRLRLLNGNLTALAHILSNGIKSGYALAVHLRKTTFIIDHLWWISVNEMLCKGKEWQGKSTRLVYIESWNIGTIWPPLTVKHPSDMVQQCAMCTLSMLVHNRLITPCQEYLHGQKFHIQYVYYCFQKELIAVCKTHQNSILSCSKTRRN
jgi:hypothetical protein